MNLKVNSVNFKGKKEILYGLTKAAKCAREYETNQTAYLASRIQMRKDEEQALKKGAMNAYLDMVTRDGDFFNTAKNIQEQDLKPIKKLLASFQTEHGIVKPMRIFESIINDVLKVSYGGKVCESVVKSSTDEFLSKLKS